MLLAVTVLIAVSGALLVHTARVWRHFHEASLGRMSARWLAERHTADPSSRGA